MALTKVSGGILDPGIDVAGIVTATGFDGPFIGGSGKNIVAGIVTCTELDLNGSGNISGNLVVEGNLTANGDFTTLNTTLREVELLRVDAQDNSVAAGIITQRGTGNILELYDTSTNILTVKDGGNLGIGTDNPSEEIHILNNNPALKLQHDVGNNVFSQIVQNGANLKIRLRNDTSNGGMHIQGNDGTDITTFVRVSNTGRVGIGTDSPDSALSITGTGSDAATRISIKDGVGIANVVGRYGNLVFQTDTDNAINGSVMTFEIDGNEAFRVNDGRKIIIGNSGVAYGSGAVQSFIAHTANAATSGFNSIDTTSVAAGVGGEISFYGKYNTGAQDYAYFGHIRGTKENATAGDTACALKFFTRPNATVPQERLRIDSSGAILMGGTSSRDIGFPHKLQLEDNDTNPKGLSIISNRNTIHASHIDFAKTRGNSLGSNAIVQDDDYLGHVNFRGADGTDLGTQASRISGAVDGTPGSNNIPGRLEFWTQTAGGSNTERLRITSGGSLKLPDNAKIELGGAQTGAGDLKLFHNGTNSKINNSTGTLYIEGTTEIWNSAGSETLAKFTTNGAVQLYHNDIERLRTYNEGVQVIGAEGGNAAILIKADEGDDNNDIYRIIAGNGTNLFFQNYATGSYVTNLKLTGDGNGAVELNYAGSTKLQTTDTGITVTGEVAATQDYPNIRPLLDFNFAAEKKLDPRITYSRTGPASFVNEFGNIVLVGGSIPRFDYGYEYVNANSSKFSKGEIKGLLIEEERTNLVGYSIYNGDKSGTAQTSSGNTGNWSLTLGHATFTGGIDAPDGSNDAVRFTALNTGFALFRISIPSFTANGSDSYTLSFYARDISGTGNITCDLQDNQPSLGSWNQNMITNEWVRIIVTNVPPSGTKNFIDIMSNSNNNRVFDIWGVQLEKGKFATSFIPTRDGTTATRGNESFEIDGEDFTDFFNATESTVLSHITPLNNSLGNHSGTGGVVWSFDSGTGFGNGNYLSNANGGTAFSHAVLVGSSAQNTGGGTGNQTNRVPFKNATVFKKDDFIMATNGTLAVADTSGNLPTVAKLVLGNNGWSTAPLNAANVHFNRFAYYPKRLPNSQLVTLTS